MTTEKKSITPKQAYKTMLTEYPDVLEICHVCEILKINRKTAYKLFENNKLYITSAFPTLLRKHDLRRIRFHDLRHTCASLLLKNGVSMKQIQEWLGHSDFSTTANIYSHLDYESKIMSANVMLEAVNLGEIAN